MTLRWAASLLLNTEQEGTVPSAASCWAPCRVHGVFMYYTSWVSALGPVFRWATPADAAGLGLGGGKN